MGAYQSDNPINRQKHNKPIVFPGGAPLCPATRARSRSRANLKAARRAPQQAHRLPTDWAALRPERIESKPGASWDCMVSSSRPFHNFWEDASTFVKISRSGAVCLSTYVWVALPNSGSLLNDSYLRTNVPGAAPTPCPTAPRCLKYDLWAHHARDMQGHCE